MIARIQGELSALGNHQDALFLQRYFKTAPGQYGAGDLFRGIRVPVLRKLAGTCRTLPLEQAEALLRSPWHEERLLALLILVRQFVSADEAGRTVIHELYLASTRYINNWDLVDVSAEHLVGGHLLERSIEPLRLLARSEALWERRIAIMATFHFIRRGRFDATLEIADMLLQDREDLIHKAVGWMLREVGKRDLRREEEFLLTRYRAMPRTMLRYAIERFPEEKRQKYLRGEMG